MIRPCAFKGCTNDYTGKGVKGLCNSHSWQLSKGRELTPILIKRDVMTPWVEQHVSHKGDECLTWPGRPTSSGYGQIKYKGKMIGAHRLMCILAHGEPPFEDAEAAHSCGKGHERCVNPNHLSWKTRQGNCEDMVAHGTRLQGVNIKWAKLTDQMVRDIREIAEVFPIPLIAAEFGLKNEHVRRVVRRLTWRHVV